MAAPEVDQWGKPLMPLRPTSDMYHPMHRNNCSDKSLFGEGTAPKCRIEAPGELLEPVRAKDAWNEKSWHSMNKALNAAKMADNAVKEAHRQLGFARNRREALEGYAAQAKRALDAEYPGSASSSRVELVKRTTGGNDAAIGVGNTNEKNMHENNWNQGSVRPESQHVFYDVPTGKAGMTAAGSLVATDRMELGEGGQHYSSGGTEEEEESLFTSRGAYSARPEVISKRSTSGASSQNRASPSAYKVIITGGGKTPKANPRREATDNFDQTDEKSSCCGTCWWMVRTLGMCFVAALVVAHVTTYYAPLELLAGFDPAMFFGPYEGGHEPDPSKVGQRRPPPRYGLKRREVPTQSSRDSTVRAAQAAESATGHGHAGMASHSSPASSADSAAANAGNRASGQPGNQQPTREEIDPEMQKAEVARRVAHAVAAAPISQVEDLKAVPRGQSLGTDDEDESEDADRQSVSAFQEEYSNGNLIVPLPADHVGHLAEPAPKPVIKLARPEIPEADTDEDPPKPATPTEQPKTAPEDLALSAVASAGEHSKDHSVNEEKRTDAPKSVETQQTKPPSDVAAVAVDAQAAATPAPPGNVNGGGDPGPHSASQTQSANSEPAKASPSTDLDTAQPAVVDSGAVAAAPEAPTSGGAAEAQPSREEKRSDSESANQQQPAEPQRPASEATVVVDSATAAPAADTDGAANVPQSDEAQAAPPPVDGTAAVANAAATDANGGNDVGQAASEEKQPPVEVASVSQSGEAPAPQAPADGTVAVADSTADAAAAVVNGGDPGSQTTSEEQKSPAEAADAPQAGEGQAAPPSADGAATLANPTPDAAVTDANGGSTAEETTMGEKQPPAEAVNAPQSGEAQAAQPNADGAAAPTDATADVAAAAASGGNIAGQTTSEEQPVTSEVANASQSGEAQAAPPSADGADPAADAAAPDANAGNAAGETPHEEQQRPVEVATAPPAGEVQGTQTPGNEAAAVADTAADAAAPDANGGNIAGQTTNEEQQPPAEVANAVQRGEAQAAQPLADGAVAVADTAANAAAHDANEGNAAGQTANEEQQPPAEVAKAPQSGEAAQPAAEGADTVADPIADAQGADATGGNTGGQTTSLDQQPSAEASRTSQSGEARAPDSAVEKIAALADSKAAEIAPLAGNEVSPSDPGPANEVRTADAQPAQPSSNDAAQVPHAAETASASAADISGGNGEERSISGEKSADAATQNEVQPAEVQPAAEAVADLPTAAAVENIEKQKASDKEVANAPAAIELQPAEPQSAKSSAEGER